MEATIDGRDPSKSSSQFQIGDKPRTDARDETMGCREHCVVPSIGSEMSRALSGLISAASNISCSRSMSLMMRSTSIVHAPQSSKRRRGAVNQNRQLPWNPSFRDEVNRKAL